MFLRGTGDVAIIATSTKLDASDRKFSQLRTREIGFEIRSMVASQSCIFYTKVRKTHFAQWQKYASSLMFSHQISPNLISHSLIKSRNSPLSNEPSFAPLLYSHPLGDMAERPFLLISI